LETILSSQSLTLVLTT